MSLTLILSILSLGCGALGKYYFVDHPKVRLEAAFVGGHRLLIIFNITNQRGGKVHISSLRGLVKKGLKREHLVIETKPHKGLSFKLPGFERETLEAEARSVFPEGSPLEAVREIYVENIANEKRWRLPTRDLRRIRASVAEYTRVVGWTLICTSCRVMINWRDRTPKPTVVEGTYSFCHPNLEPGWSQMNFQPPSTSGRGVCPECTRRSTLEEGSTESIEN